MLVFEAARMYLLEVWSQKHLEHVCRWCVPCLGFSKGQVDSILFRRGSVAKEFKNLVLGVRHCESASVSDSPPGIVTMSEWIEEIDPDSGYPYYLNTVTGASTWERPPEMPQRLSQFV